MARRCVGVRHVAAPNAVEKIAVMDLETDGPAHLFDEFVARTVKLPAVVLAEYHHTLRPVKCVSVLVPFLHVRGPEAMFVDELSLFAA
jgi:hypothetical protein